MKKSEFFLLVELAALVYSVTSNEISIGDVALPHWATESPDHEGNVDIETAFSLPTVFNRLKLPEERKTVQNITGQLGASVFMPCQTQHSMERQVPQVSWIRKSDWHILTSGTKPYTKEERFAVHHPEGSTQWTLAIKYLRLEDAGAYECQIATGTGLTSNLVNLEVVVPRAFIPGNGEYHVESGSTIRLECFIEQSPEAPQYIFWYHNNKMINYDRERGGVTVRITPGPRVQSTLTMTDAKLSDSGNYTCAAANTDPAVITVYITAVNKIAAIQPRAVDSEEMHRSSFTLFAVTAMTSWLIQRFLATCATEMPSASKKRR